MYDIQNSQLAKISWVLFFLVVIAIVRLVSVQLIDHQYYESKVVKQRKMSKEISLRKEYLILPKNAIYTIEINLWLLVDKNRNMVFRDSMRNLSKLTGIDEQIIYTICLDKFNVVKRIIQRKLKEEYVESSNQKELEARIEHREFNKPYPLNIRKISKDEVMLLETNKYQWLRKKNERELDIYDRFRGFSIRVTTKTNQN